jgi:hypothetical protein
MKRSKKRSKKEIIKKRSSKKRSKKRSKKEIIKKRSSKKEIQKGGEHEEIIFKENRYIDSIIIYLEVEDVEKEYNMYKIHIMKENVKYELYYYKFKNEMEINEITYIISTDRCESIEEIIEKIKKQCIYIAYNTRTKIYNLESLLYNIDDDSECRKISGSQYLFIIKYLIRLTLENKEEDIKITLEDAASVNKELYIGDKRIELESVQRVYLSGLYILEKYITFYERYGYLSYLLRLSEIDSIKYEETLNNMIILRREILNMKVKEITMNYMETKKIRKSASRVIISLYANMVIILKEFLLEIKEDDEIEDEIEEMLIELSIIEIKYIFLNKYLETYNKKILLILIKFINKINKIIQIDYTEHYFKTDFRVSSDEKGKSLNIESVFLEEMERSIDIKSGGFKDDIKSVGFKDDIKELGIKSGININLSIKKGSLSKKKFEDIKRKYDLDLSEIHFNLEKNNEYEIRFR